MPWPCFGVMRPGPVPGIFEAETLAAPPNLAGREFAAAWARWCSYRRSKGIKMKLRVMLGCARLGMPAAVEAIDFAIANGWNSLAVCMGP